MTFRFDPLISYYRRLPSLPPLDIRAGAYRVISSLAFDVCPHERLLISCSSVRSIDDDNVDRAFARHKS